MQDRAESPVAPRIPASSLAVGTTPPDQFAAVLQLPLVTTQVRTVADPGDASSAGDARIAAARM